jgi:hypothetical protein
MLAAVVLPSRGLHETPTILIVLSFAALDAVIPIEANAVVATIPPVRKFLRSIVFSPS